MMEPIKFLMLQQSLNNNNVSLSVDSLVGFLLVQQLHSLKSFSQRIDIKSLH